MKILLTGHLGFIGSRLYEKLVINGHEVVGIDIKEGTDILTAPLPKVDFVIHLAGIGGVRESLADPAKYWNTNVEGTKRILEHYKNVRVLVAGSSSQYEPHLNPYAASKNVIENIPHPNVCLCVFIQCIVKVQEQKCFLINYLTVHLNIQQITKEILYI